MRVDVVNMLFDHLVDDPTLWSESTTLILEAPDQVQGGLALQKWLNECAVAWGDEFPDTASMKHASLMFRCLLEWALKQADYPMLARKLRHIIASDTTASPDEA